MASNPPFDARAERLIIGMMILLPESAPEWENILRPDDFFPEKHRQLVRAIYALRERGATHDAIAVSHYLSTQHAQTSPYLSQELAEIMEEATLEGSVDHLRTHVERVRAYSVVREMQTLGSVIALEASGVTVDVERWLDSVTQRVMDITQRVSRAETPKDVRSITERTVNHLVTGGTPSGVVVPPALGHVRQLWSRMHNKLYFVAARPGVGKTSLIYRISNDIARSGAGICVNLSWEMDEEELVMRELSARTGRSVDELDVSTTGEATKYRDIVLHAGGRMKIDLPASIDYCPSLPVEQVQARVRRRFWEAQQVYGQDKKLALVTLDYLQLMRPQKDRGNANANLEHITRELALMAGELKVPFLVGCQLNRESVKRTDSRPNLGDLRGSGAIEQDAFGVLFLHRDEKDDSSGETEVIVAKQRRGPKGTGYLTFEGRTTNFRPSPRLSKTPANVEIQLNESPVKALDAMDLGFQEETRVFVDEGQDAPPYFDVEDDMWSKP